jgi:RNA polymerase sigma-54 factor
MEFISRLNPSPREDQVAMSIDTIIPDISVEEKQGSFQIVINESVLPEIRVSPTYLNMLNSHKEQSDVVRFIKKKIESANWFVDAVKGRKHTIEKVMESIIKYQSDYFREEDRVLRPMILDDIAKDIEMDISTVSRVTNGKYVQLPWEIKELKKFFSESIQMKSGEEVSNVEVKKRLSEMIELEDKTNPLGDIELTEKLNVEGYKIARRTVSKYREKLNFPTARLRRKI